MLKKCEKCGRFFGDEGQTVCSACRMSSKGFKSTGDPERDKFVMTRDIVYENPDISPQGIIDIMSDMGVEITIREIMKYVDEGRLSLNTVKDGNHCQRCGTRISFGKYCDRCRFKLEQQNKMEGGHDDDDKPRIKMHTSKS
ncbi:MAG: hypothetical protein LCH34_00695 [Firmicutes bacterium]|nr:hypothetical protein [Bacillota bacterium]